MLFSVILGYKNLSWVLKEPVETPVASQIILKPALFANTVLQRIFDKSTDYVFDVEDGRDD